MAEIKWIKITTSIFDDEAIKIIEQMPEGDALLVIWLKLLIQAGITNDSGLIYFKEDIPYTENMLAIVFHKPVTLIRLALSTFEKFGMIEIADNQTILIRNWEKHQNAERLNKIREDTRERVRKYRERQKTSCSVTPALHVTQCNAQEVRSKNKEVRNKKEDIYSSSSSIDENLPKISEEEEELLKNHSKRNKVKYFKPWLRKILENGDYKEILEKERQRQKREEEKVLKEKTEIPVETEEEIEAARIKAASFMSEESRKNIEARKKRRRQNNDSSSKEN